MAQDDAAYGLLCNSILMYAYNIKIDLSYALDNLTTLNFRPQDIKAV
jgi:hypothetical protein